MIYIGLAVFVFILDYIYVRVQERQKKVIWLLACFCTWFIIAFRDYYVGGDTIGYVQGFDRMKYMAWDRIIVNVNKDVGFAYLNKGLSVIWDNKIWFLASTAFLSLVGVFSYIRRNTTRPVLALFFYITLANFCFIITGMRQAIAMSFCLLALPFAERKQPIRFAVLVVLGALCHKSAFIFLLAYFVVRRKITTGNMLVNVLAIAAAFFGYETLLAYANELLEYDYGVEELSNGGIFFCIVLTAVLLAWILRHEWIKNERDTVSMNMSVITTGMWTIRLFSRTIERPAMYWLNALPVVLSNVIESQKGKKSYQYIYYIAVLAAFVLYIRRASGMPYRFVF